MFKEMAQFASLMKQAQGMSGKVQEMKDRMANLRCEGQAGGGMVSVEVGGQLQMLACRIDPAILATGDKEMLEDLICAATNQAFEKLRETQTKEMQQVMGGLDISSLSGMLGGIGGMPQ